MKAAPDFILKHGEGAYSGPELRRECWVVGKTRVSWIDAETRVQEADILVVRTEPKIFSNGLSGLANRSALHGVEEFGRANFAAAVVWQVEALADGTYSACQSLGLTLVYSVEADRNQKHHFQQE